jgi:hypothetical protein
MQGVQTRQQAICLLRHGFDDGEPVLLLGFQVRELGRIGRDLGGDLLAECPQFVLIPLELHAPLRVDGSLPAYPGSP